MSWAPAVRIVERATLPALRLTLLIPEHGDAAGSALQISEVRGARASGALWLRLASATGETVQIVARGVGAPTQVGPMTTDARIAVARGASEGSTIFTSGGTRVDWAHAV
jgi:hypothetical protein